MSPINRAYVDTSGRLPGMPDYDFTASKAGERGLDEPCTCGVMMSPTEQDVGACMGCQIDAACDLREQEFEAYKKEKADGERK